MKKIIIILFLIFQFSCDINNKKLLLVNNTNRPIYYLIFIDSILNTKLQIYKIEPYDSACPNFIMGYGKNAWEHKIFRESKDSTLHLFLFSDDRLDQDIIKNRKYKRFDYKVKDLNRLNWRIIYNGK